MANLTLFLERPVVGFQESQEETRSSHRRQSSESLSSEDGGATSGYSSCDEDSIFGGVKQTPNYCEDSHSSLLNTALTEADATDMCKYIGRNWKSLGRELKFSKTTLDDISDDKCNHSYEDKAHALLIKLIHRHGSDATKGWLAEALFKIGRRDVAEKLVGKEHFANTTPEQQSFFLKEESSFAVPDEDDQDVRFFTCRNIDNGRLYLVRELVGTGYEESCKALKQQDTIADSVLKTLDVNSIAKAEKQRKEKLKFKDAQEKTVEILMGLQDIVISLENQQRKEKKIRICHQLHEDETLLEEMQDLATDMVHLSSDVSRLEDPFPLEAQMYSFCIGLSGILRDLEERVRMLREMVPRSQMETEKFDQLLNRSRSLGKDMKTREKHFRKRFQKLTLESQQRLCQGQNWSSSKPPPRTNGCPVNTPGIKEASSQSSCEKESKPLREQVSPAPGPMEQDEESSIC